MPGSSTKQKILDASIRLFNENGMANVRLQQIASSIGISPGNLAYHFRNKKAIIAAINEDLIREAEEILSAYRVYPNLLDFDQQLSRYFAFIQKYPFYFLDILEIKRNYPEIGYEAHLRVISTMVTQIRERFVFNQKRGLIREEPRTGIYSNIADTIWNLIAFWGPQHLVKNPNSAEDTQHFKEVIWNQFYPYFTPKGIAEYEQLILPLLMEQSVLQ